MQASAKGESMEEEKKEEERKDIVLEVQDMIIGHGTKVQSEEENGKDRA